MAETGGAVVDRVLTESTHAPFYCIRRSIRPVLKHQTYLDDLDNKLQELKNKKHWEEVGIEDAVTQGHEIHVDVNQWLNDVNELIELVENCTTGLRVQGQANAHCFRGICPNLVMNYKLNKQAEEAEQCTAKFLGSIFPTVSYPPPARGAKSMYLADCEAFDLRKSVLQVVMEALQNAKVNKIGVYGMGGIGKTTLVNEIATRAIQYWIFDDVLVVDISPDLDLKKIREKMVSDLGLKFGIQEAEPNMDVLPRDRLKKGKGVLVILDNIWAKLHLKDIGIPLPNEDEQEDEETKCKILLTSRSPDLSHNAMDTQKNFALEMLTNGGAQCLFWKIVGYPATDRSEFQAMTKELVRKCAGLLLAVTTIASALKNQTLSHWKDALDRLQMYNQMCIPDMDEPVFKIIKLSFDLLQSDKAKSLFLLCNRVGQGVDVSLEHLLRYGMGLGLFQGVNTLEGGSNRLDMLIKNLKALCLLLEGNSNNWVKMHNIIHAVAVSIASTDKLMFSIGAVAHLCAMLKEKI